jgi:hypothetical protein
MAEKKGRCHMVRMKTRSNHCTKSQQIKRASLQNAWISRVTTPFEPSSFLAYPLTAAPRLALLTALDRHRLSYD